MIYEYKGNRFVADFDTNFITLEKCFKYGATCTKCKEMGEVPNEICTHLDEILVELKKVFG